MVASMLIPVILAALLVISRELVLTQSKNISILNNMYYMTHVNITRVNAEYTPSMFTIEYQISNVRVVQPRLFPTRTSTSICSTTWTRLTGNVMNQSSATSPTSGLAALSKVRGYTSQITILCFEVPRSVLHLS